MTPALRSKSDKGPYLHKSQKPVLCRPCSSLVSSNVSLKMSKDILVHTNVLRRLDFSEDILIVSIAGYESLNGCDFFIYFCSQNVNFSHNCGKNTHKKNTSISYVDLYCRSVKRQSFLVYN